MSDSEGEGEEKLPKKEEVPAAKIELAAEEVPAPAVHVPADEVPAASADFPASQLL